MRLSTLLFPASLALITLGAPLDNTILIPARTSHHSPPPPPSPDSLVILSVFNDAECRDPGAGIDVDDGGLLDIVNGEKKKCFELGSGGSSSTSRNNNSTSSSTTEGEEKKDGGRKWGGLKVLWAHEKLRYNSLRVYESSDCSGPWTLQPIRCGGTADDDGGTCACSQIVTYNSIKLLDGE
ncbi:hypothetical protein DM02DRAFT_674945 [Periconia macrospinosa]|uniref:Uncharacterized protein n=1 Tax=Periconia macrospinosa TaxID=97972 RepID=A0A2V1DDJ7_9PLEO|nr:hypothetical protein DM02DRAFT_674945 [Periconia macrospinosa]